jgi:thiosulfate/3-mercaptopyruvate sulfurtransferase
MEASGTSLSDADRFGSSGEPHDLVSAAWLAEGLRDPSIVIVDASVARGPAASVNWAAERAAFEAGHIPGTRFADLVSDFSEPGARFAFTRPSGQRFAAAAGAIGLVNGRRVVFYDNSTGIWAARLWWLFKAFGHDQASVLDGGLTAWRAEGRALEQGSGGWTRTDFRVDERPGFFIDKSEVFAIAEERANGLLACVLRAPVFAGTEVAYTRAGHIPLSRNLPYRDLLGPDNRLLPRETLRRALAPLIESKDRVVLYCGGGVTAAGAALALTILGRRDVSIYDGSLSEWSADLSLPMVVGQ